jgi:uncharacterized membrane protein YraQ (UPF0718 family)
VPAPVTVVLRFSPLAMIDALNEILDSILTGAGLFWRALWALAFGYAISAAIQVFVSRERATQYLGEGTPPQLALAAVLGFISSSCSFAALSATRSLITKGAALKSALAFMFASTNLAIEVAALSFIFLGWQYSLALFVGAPVLIATMSIFVTVTKPDQLFKQAIQHAEEAESEHQHGESTGRGPLKERLTRIQEWQTVGVAYLGEWRMVYVELFAGFLAAGFVATLVPESFFEALFPTGGSVWWQLPVQALMAPVIALITVIGSMGNGPLAAILANNGVLFGAIMTFLYADFLVPPALRINARYYGWKFSAYLAAVFTVSAVLSGIAVHLIFAAVDALPDGAKSIDELSRFKLDYTLVLNILSLITAASLLYLRRQARMNGGH